MYDDTCSHIFSKDILIMAKFLIYSQNPITNYNKFKSLFIIYFIISLLVSVMVYFSKGLILSILTFLFLLFVMALEFYTAKSCLNEKNNLVLEKAYENGKKINFITQVLLYLFWIYLFGLLYGTMLLFITLISQLLIIKKEK